VNDKSGLVEWERVLVLLVSGSMELASQPHPHPPLHEGPFEICSSLGFTGEKSSWRYHLKTFTLQWLK